MKAIKLAWLELRRFRGRLLRLVPVVLVLVPLLFGALYLWSNWDPYGRLHEVPVAVVNSDRPVESNGERIHAGELFVQHIKATGMFQWHLVDADDARRGLERGHYYFTIEVPADFSTKLVTATQIAPEGAAVVITKNDANGHVAGMMADAMQSDLRREVNAAARGSYAKALYGGLDGARDKLRVASETSRRLVENTELSKQTTAALAKGITGAQDGSGRIAQSAQDISDATSRLETQLSPVTDLSDRQLPETADAVVNASNVAVNSLGSIKDGTGFVHDRATQNVSTLEELGRKHPVLGADPAYQRALTNARDLSNATSNADSDADRALNTVQDANNQALALQREIRPLQEQVRMITDPVDALRSSTGELTVGSDNLGNAMKALASGSGALQTGAGQMRDAAKRLDGLVNDGMHRIPPTEPPRPEQPSDALESPSEIRTTTLNAADIHGRGLAPLSFAMALWMFGLLAYLLLRPVNERALASRTGALSLAVAGWLPSAALGVVAALVLLAAVDVGLGLAPQHLLWTAGLLALAAVAFVAIHHFLRTAFGVLGSLLALVLLIVQLAASGGLYPVETLPLLFQALHPFLPMSYVVDGLRVTISGGMVEHLLRDVGVLAGFLVVFVALTALVVQRHRVWTVERLHPHVQL